MRGLIRFKEGEYTYLVSKKNLKKFRGISNKTIDKPTLNTWEKLVKLVTRLKNNGELTNYDPVKFMLSTVVIKNDVVIKDMRS